MSGFNTPNGEESTDSLQKNQALAIVRSLGKTTDVIALPSGAHVYFDKTTQDNDGSDCILVCFPDEQGGREGPRLSINLEDPHGKSTLLLPPESDDPDALFEEVKPSSSELIAKVDEVLAAIVTEMEKQKAAEVSGIQDDVSDATSVLDALNI